MTRADVRQKLLALLPTVRSATDVRAAIDLLEPETRLLTPAEQLLVARSAALSGRDLRAVAGFASALRAEIMTDADQYAYGEALLRLGRARDAAAQFAGVARTSALYGVASYQRARSLLRAGDGAAAGSALLRTAREFATDTIAAASSLYLLGDLAADAGRNAEARDYFRSLSGTFPTSSFAPQARLRAAMMSLAAGSTTMAASELDTLYTRYPNHSEALAALYWSGRAWKEAGRDSLARSRWRAVVDRNGASYYALLAARSLGEPTWTPPPPGAGDTLLRYADVDSAMIRMGLLLRLGFNDEARFEEEQLVRAATGSVSRVLATAQAFVVRGNTSRAIALARRALDLGAAPTSTVYRLLYPVAAEPVLLAESRRNKLDPALVAALIKQESNFTPGATSPAGARGLMQVMPPVGRVLAQSMGFPVWDAALLYQPDVNVQLGTRHLAAALARYSNPAMALAGYNAGDARVKRWLAALDNDDAELFVERIPFIETRDYVRIVLRNREMYRALYGWPM